MSRLNDVIVVASGHMMYVRAAGALASDYAHLISTNILASTNHCVKFFYTLTSGILSLRVTSQTGDAVVWSVSHDDVNEWHKAYVKLPEGWVQLSC